MLVDAKWRHEMSCEDSIDLTIDRTTTNLAIEEAFEVFSELSRILFGRVLKDKENQNNELEL